MKSTSLKKISFLFCASLTVVLTACTSIGPKLIPQDRYSYNIAMENSNNRELLLNIVRLRYDDAPFFLNVTNISAGYRLEKQATANVSGIFTNLHPAYNTSLGGQALYRENPIINYAPLAGQKYAVQLLTPLPLSDLALVLQSGWNIARVFRIAIQCIGHVCNATNAARPTSLLAPRFSKFNDIVHLLRDLQVRDLLTGDYHKINKTVLLALHISPNARLTTYEKQLLSQAGIRVEHNTILLTTSPHPKPNETFLATRSELEILNYVSKGVMLSPLDIEKHLVVVTRYPDGRPFDWQQVLSKIMKIHQSQTNLPPEAAIAIQYRGRWFYILDSDETSKKTILLLSLFLELLQAKQIVNQPIYAISQNGS